MAAASATTGSAAAGHGQFTVAEMSDAALTVCTMHHVPKRVAHDWSGRRGTVVEVGTVKDRMLILFDDGVLESRWESAFVAAED